MRDQNAIDMADFVIETLDIPTDVFSTEAERQSLGKMILRQAALIIASESEE